VHPVFSTDVCAVLVILSIALIMTAKAVENILVMNKM